MDHPTTRKRSAVWILLRFDLRHSRLHHPDGFLNAVSLAIQCWDIVSLPGWASTWPGFLCADCCTGASPTVKRSSVMKKRLPQLFARQAFKEAGELGFEPRLTGPEPVVLPLHHSPMAWFLGLLWPSVDYGDATGESSEARSYAWPEGGDFARAPAMYRSRNSSAACSCGPGSPSRTTRTT